METMANDGERTRRSGIGEDHPAGRIEDDHRELRERLDVLMETEDRKGVLSRLKELPRMLAEHFAEEEGAGGLFEDLALRCPPICKDLDALRREHRAILDELETLSREMESHPDPHGSVEETTRAVAHCVERLRRHERAEAKMIADVYYTDEGGRG
jgi:hypothetical protein